MLDFLSKKKKIALIVAMLILITLVLPMVRCSSLSQVEQENPPADETTTSSVMVEGDEGSLGEVDETNVSDRQQELISSYDNETKELLGLLQANVWTANKDTSTIRFTDSSYTESANNTTVTTSFAICGIEEDENMVSGVNGESETTTDTTVTLMYEDGTYGIMHLLLTESTSSPTPALTINSADFHKSKSYIRTKAANGLSVEGLNDDAKVLIDQKTEDLEKYLTEYCSIYYPTSSVATWDQKLTANYNSNMIELSFTLNNLGQSRIAVDYDLAYNKFGVGGM